MGVDSGGADTTQGHQEHTTKPRLCDGLAAFLLPETPRVGCLLKAVHCSDACECVSLETIQISVRERPKEPGHGPAADYSAAVQGRKLVFTAQRGKTASGMAAGETSCSVSLP